MPAVEAGDERGRASAAARLLSAKWRALLLPLVCARRVVSNDNLIPTPFLKSSIGQGIG